MSCSNKVFRWKRNAGKVFKNSLQNLKKNSGRRSKLSMRLKGKPVITVFEFNFLFVQLCSWQCQNDKHSIVYVEFTLRMWPLFFGCSSTSSSMQFNRQRKSLTLTTNGDIICSPMTYIDCYTRLLRIVPALESPKSTSVVS